MSRLDLHAQVHSRASPRRLPLVGFPTPVASHYAVLWREALIEGIGRFQPWNSAGRSVLLSHCGIELL